MKQPFLLSAVLFCCCFFLLPWTSCTDVQRPGSMNRADSMVALALEQKMFALQFRNPDSAWYYASRVHELRRYHRGPEEDMDYYERAMVYKFLAGDTQQARYYHDSAVLCLRQAPENQMLQYREAYIRGVYFMAVDQQDSAIAAFLQSLQILPESADSVLSINVYGYLAQLYLAQKNYPSAIRYYRSILNYALSRSQKGMQEIAFMVDAYTYYSKGNPKEQEEAAQFLFDAYHEMQRIGDSSLYAPLFYNLAAYYLKRGHEDSAMYYAQSSIKAKDNGPELIQQAHAAYNIVVDYLLNHGRFDEAMASFARQQQETDTALYDLDDKKAYYRNAHRIYAQTGQEQAAMYTLKQELRLSEEIGLRDKNEQLLLHEKEIRRLSAERIIAKKDKEISQQRVYLILGVFVSLLLVLLLLLAYLNIQKRNKLAIQSAAYAKKQQELEQYKMLLEERNRIAQEMHDDLGTTLTSTFMALELLKTKSDSETYMDMLEGSTQKLSTQINEVIWNLNMRNDTLANLSAYIIRFARKFLQTAGIAFKHREDFSEDGSRYIHSSARRAVYLTVKELLNNMVKYAGAQNAYLYIYYKEGHLHLLLGDDGLGFDGAASNCLKEASRGNGLFNIRQRIGAEGGTIVWQSGKEGCGTEVHIDVLLQEQKSI